MFFVEDTGDPDWRVVIFHQPRSKRVIGPDAHDLFRMDDDEMALETPLPEVAQTASTTCGAPHEVPLAQVQSINAQLSLIGDEAIYVDTQYEDDMDMDMEGVTGNLA